MIFRASEPSVPRGDKPNREIILALLAMSFLVAIMIRYSRSLWCDQLPMLCLPDRATSELAPDAEIAPQELRPDSRPAGFEAPADRTIDSTTGGDAPLGFPIDSMSPGFPSSAGIETVQPEGSTVERSIPTLRSSPTPLATRAAASIDATADASSGAGRNPTATPIEGDESGGSGDGSYPGPGATRFPTRTPSPTPEDYPGP